MRLWLDDNRKPPDGWHWVRTAEETIAWLKTDTVTEASLDHDLGDDIGLDDFGRHAKTGYDVLEWLERHPEYFPPEGIEVHSMNPAGRRRMEALCQKIQTSRKS